MRTYYDSECPSIHETCLEVSMVGSGSRPEHPHPSSPDCRNSRRNGKFFRLRVNYNYCLRLSKKCSALHCGLQTGFPWSRPQKPRTTSMVSIVHLALDIVAVENFKVCSQDSNCDYSL
jgi:hypothetical protein